jgi:prepilin-type N-terminal cleavage/methylation domain-containing protein
VTVAKMQAKRCASRERGFSLIEMVTVVAISLIVAAMAVVAMNPTRQQSQADAAMYTVSSEFRKAREWSIEQRRDIVVTFNNGCTNCITLTRQNVPLGTTQLETVSIDQPVTFRLTPGMPDTPDGFGNGSAIEFEGIAGGPPGMMFQSDGTLIDAAGNLVNGTVFMGVVNVPSTARAVTVLGATGKIQTYRGTGTGWEQ